MRGVWKPFPSIWIADEDGLAGPIVDRYSGYNRSGLILCCELFLQTSPKTLSICKLSLKDEESQSMKEAIRKSLEFYRRIDPNDKSPVVVCCEAGLSRSVTIAMVLWMYAEKKNLEEAWKKILDVRPAAAPNRSFVQELLRVEKAVSSDFDSSWLVQENGSLAKNWKNNWVHDEHIMSNRGRRRIKAKLKELGVVDNISNPTTQICKALIREEERSYRLNRKKDTGFPLTRRALEIYPYYKMLVVDDLFLRIEIETLLQDLPTGPIYKGVPERNDLVLSILVSCTGVTLDNILEMQAPSTYSPLDARIDQMILEQEAAEKIKKKQDFIKHSFDTTSTCFLPEIVVQYLCQNMGGFRGLMRLRRVCKNWQHSIDHWITSRLHTLPPQSRPKHTIVLSNGAVVEQRMCNG